MIGPSSRISRQHLLALCTFLVPLAVLAYLGQSELQRRDLQVDAALEREAQQFVQGAAVALRQQLDRELPAIDAQVQELLAEFGPVRTPIELRARGNPSLLDILLLDAQNALVWPTPPLPSDGLPLLRDHQPRGEDSSIAAALRSADLLLSRNDLDTANEVLRDLIQVFEQANPPGRRRDVDDAELTARFRMGTIARKRGDGATARAQFEAVRNATIGNSRRYDYETRSLGLLAELALAEAEQVADQLGMLRTLAEGGRDAYAAEGLLAAVAQRLVAHFPSDHAQAGQAQVLLREVYQRVQSRTFAGDFDLLLKESLRRKLRQHADGTSEDHTPTVLVSKLDATASLLWVRAATSEERNTLHGTRVCLRFDLDQLMTPLLSSYLDGDGSLALAIHDPEGTPIVPAPTESFPGFSPPQATVLGIELTAHPSNASQRLADYAAEERTRATLLVTLFLAALGGALWLWRSVSQQAELARLKVELVSRVSHELKTPLALIRMYGETLGLGRAQDSAQAAQFGGIIARESERLTNLIQRILDFSRQQAGTLNYAPEPLDLGQLLQSVADAYTPHLESRGAMLEEDLPLGIWVTCDANACESAVVNLLENAAKYGRDGVAEQTIELSLRRDKSQAIVEVRDRGRGIPPDEIERIFAGFYRAKNAGEVRGAGLGLSLVQHFAEAHGGTVTASCRPGGGSIFRLVLPTDPIPPRPSAAPTSRAEQS